MNQEFKKKWVAALRSGEYKQIKGSLHTDDGFCCLGVACDLYAKETGLVNWIKKPNNPDYRMYDNYGVLPVSVFAYMGLNGAGDANRNGRLEAKDRSDNDTCLSTLNDKGFTFDQIADLIDYFC